MIVKTKRGQLGRISKPDKKDSGNLKVKVMILNENMHPIYKGNEPVYEYHFIYDLIFRPKIIVNL